MAVKLTVFKIIVLYTKGVSISSYNNLAMFQNNLCNEAFRSKSWRKSFYLTR